MIFVKALQTGTYISTFELLQVISTADQATDGVVKNDDDVDEVAYLTKFTSASNFDDLDNGYRCGKNLH
ncbi:hypothetical protein [Candidatus Epulonipiscium viviparus]|uniref:hypothetical protein n=1 Tax=Candidatus Epulonipiscium viviparus TaxID=420336 RepID=UPI002738090D|nr:hypothetical protein [Candidatus Epulopiscium viviparus]